MEYKLTNKDFDLFRAECKKWIDRFGLCSWHIDFAFEHDGEPGDCLGSFEAMYTGRIATIRLTPVWEDCNFKRAQLKQEIKRVALHEVLHVLLSPLGSLAECRTWNYDDYDKERHSVIRVLENYLLGDKSRRYLVNQVKSVNTS